MPLKTPASPSFTVPGSAAEEAEMEIAVERWDNEGGRGRSTSAIVRHVAGAEFPYVVVLSRLRGLSFERSFATMREAEAFLRRTMPAPAPALSTLYDQPSET